MAEEMVQLKSLEEQKLRDIHAKLDIVKLVIKICLAKQYDVDLIKKVIVEKASEYFSREIITHLLAQVHTPKTFNDWDELIKMTNLDASDNSYTWHLDTLLRNLILIQNSLPTKESVFQTLKNSPKISLNQSQLEVSLKTRGYKSKRLPQCTKTILVEDPERSLARMKYLHSIEQFRSAGLPIIYIEVKKNTGIGSPKHSDEDVTMYYLAVSSSLGLISNKVTNISYSSVPVKKYYYYYLLSNWILETVVPYLSTPSVFVLEDQVDSSNTYIDTPTIYSSRTKMKNWLDQNDIPHNPDMHSAEFFELIKKFNRNLLRRNDLDENLMSYGHKILRRPRNTQYLNYFNSLWGYTFDKPNMDSCQKININTWKQMETMLCEIERKTLDEDITVNKTTEKLLTFAEHKPMSFNFIESDDFDEFKMVETVHIDP